MAKHIWFAAAGSSSTATNAIWRVGEHEEDYEAEGLDRFEAKARRARTKQMIAELNGGKLFEPEDWGRVWRPLTIARPKKPKEFNSFGGGIYVVTARLKAFLETHDIGPVRFHPIEVLNVECTAPLWPGVELFHMNVGTVKRALDLRATPGNAQGRLGSLPDGAPLYKPRAIDEHDVYVFDPSVCAGPELWIDDTLQGALFVSDALATALKSAKLDKGWQLLRCGVAAVH